MNGLISPYEEGVMGSVEGVELLDPDDDEETIATSLGIKWMWMGEEERGDKGEQMGEDSLEGETCEDHCQEPTFTDDFKLCFSAKLPHLLSFKFPFSQPLIIETRQNN